MIQTVQLELDFFNLIKRAKTSFSVEDWKQDWNQLCCILDTAISQVSEAPINDRIAVEVEAIVTLTEVFYARASQLGSFSIDEPDKIIFEEDFFDQYQAEIPNFDFAQYLNKERRYVRSKVAEISKEKALEFAYEPELELEPEPILTEPEVVEAIALLEHDEDIAAWAEAIREWMKRNGVESVSMMEIVEETNLSLVKVWISGLLSELGLHQTKDFYSFDGLRIFNKNYLKDNMR